MTPKEKAIELVKMFQDEMPANYIFGGKKCAAKCVEQLLLNSEVGKSKKDNDGNSIPVVMYWKFVKDEIDNL